MRMHAFFPRIIVVMRDVLYPTIAQLLKFWTKLKGSINAIKCIQNHLFMTCLSTIKFNKLKKKTISFI